MKETSFSARKTKLAFILAYFREMFHLTLDDLQELSGVSRSCLYDWELGRAPTDIEAINSVMTVYNSFLDKGDTEDKRPRLDLDGLFFGVPIGIEQTDNNVKEYLYSFFN